MCKVLLLPLSTTNLRYVKQHRYPCLQQLNDVIVTLPSPPTFRVLSFFPLRRTRVFFSYLLVFSSRLLLSSFTLTFYSYLSLSSFTLVFRSRLPLLSFTLVFRSRLLLSSSTLIFYSRLPLLSFTLVFHSCLLLLSSTLVFRSCLPLSSSVLVFPSYFLSFVLSYLSSSSYPFPFILLTYIHVLSTNIYALLTTAISSFLYHFCKIKTFFKIYLLCVYGFLSRRAPHLPIFLNV